MVDPAMGCVIGCLVPPPPWSAEFVGISAKAVSLLHGDGALVSIVRSMEAMEARALAHPEGFRAFASALSRIDDGQDARITLSWDGRLMQIKKHGGADYAGATLDFEGAGVWDPRRGGPSQRGLPHIDAQTARRAIGTIRRVIGQAHEDGRPFEGIHAVGAYAAAFERHSQVDDFPANLVGFGPGTTPAGDDWLAGYLIALDLAGGTELTGRDPARLRAEQLRAVLADRLGRTTAAGRALLLGVIEGVPPAYLHELSLAAAAGNEAGRLAKCTKRALEHGATSGEDALAGFTAGLAVCFDR
jgi:hypothetical protein